MYIYTDSICWRIKYKENDHPYSFHGCSKRTKYVTKEAKYVGRHNCKENENSKQTLYPLVGPASYRMPKPSY